MFCDFVSVDCCKLLIAEVFWRAAAQESQTEPQKFQLHVVLITARPWRRQADVLPSVKPTRPLVDGRLA
jgi:hypothetical protein